MKFKVVPEPRDVAFLREAASAVPLVPGSVEDCCQRVMQRTDVAARDDAREYLTFLRALGLVEETDSGFHRMRDAPDDAELAERFVERVYLAEAVLAALPGTADEVFAAVRDDVPEWERRRHDDFEAVWRERVERLLAWATEFGLAEREGGRYVRA